MKKSISLIILLGFLFGGVFASPSLTFAQSDIIISYGENADYENALSRMGSCSFTEWAPCFLKLYYYAVLVPSAYLVYITGAIFDYFLAYSIDSDSYTGVNNEFVERGWSVIRDIANITFIFSLLYVAIMHILQADSGKTKKFLKDIIIAALLINFSLFFTKIIIDGGNILARAFYNNIEVENDDNTDYKTLSQGVASYVNPQSILTSKFFNPVISPGRLPAPPSPGWIFLVLVMSTIVNVVLSLTFLSVFLLFAARVIGLWFMMIFSPLAFVSIAFPWGKGVLGRFSFLNWLKETVSLSFMAPVFLFFLFLLIMFLQIVYTSSVPVADRSSIQQFLSIIIPFVSIILILTMAKKQAKEMAGQVGEQTVAWSGKIAGYSMMVAGALLGATGGAVIGSLGRGIVGRFAAKQASSEKIKNLASRKGFKGGVARRYQRLANYASNSSFDFRNTGLSKRTSGLLEKGLSASGLSGVKVNFGEGTKKGGYVQRLEAYQKKKEDYQEKLKPSAEADREVNVDYRDANGNLVRLNNVTSSLVQSEADLLRVQNDAKRSMTQGNVLNTQTRQVETLEMTYDDWKSQKDKAQKGEEAAQKRYQIAQQDFATGRINQAALNIEQNNLRRATQRHTELRGIVSGIENSWAREEAVYKAIQTAHNTAVTERLRNYADSVAPDGLNALYELAKGQYGMGLSARESASANISLAAEKSEKKAQAQEKKDNA